MRIIFLVIILIISSRVCAQDTTRNHWKQQVKASLNMTKEQYSRYITVNEEYKKQVTKIMADFSLDKGTKITEIVKALTVKKTIIKQLFTADQIKKLAKFDTLHPVARGPFYYKHHQEREAYMNKKIQDRARADSARLKPACQ
jgi:hypothetical protein